MDIKRFKFLDWESIYNFLKINSDGIKKNQPTKKKMLSIFRRLDFNADTKLVFNEFSEAIKPVEVYQDEEAT